MIKSDLIIIGAGPGGYETALHAAKHGVSVTLFEGRKLGGTCLNEGCIPTKCLCKNAEVLTQIKESEQFGIDDFTFSFDFDKAMQRKNNVVDTLRQGIQTMLSQAKVNVVNEFAKFKDSHTIIAGEEEYTADNIIIATGSKSRSLPIPGADMECVMDSTNILEIDHIPESLMIIGGGVIGMEFASIFNAMGSKVTVVEYMKQILPPFDSDIAKRLKQNLSKQGIEIITGAAVTRIEQNADYTIHTVWEAKGSENSTSTTDILMAVGRLPYFDGLNLEAAGIEYSAKGIVVNENMQTNVPHIYAIGDANGGIMLAHVATYEGLRALNTINSTKDSIHFDVIPSAVFTYPECGMVGVTQDYCKAKGVPVKIGQSFYRANGKALALGEPDGLCKLIFNAEDMRLIGAHIMGVQAADLAQQAADLMSVGITQSRMTDIIFSHPTVSEILLTAATNLK